MSGKPLTIVVVDDDQIDVMAIERSLRKSRVGNPIVVASDGVDALHLLRGENGKTVPKRPYIILLDINMPRMDGHQFLTELRADPVLSDAVVFMLTTSKEEEDVLACYAKYVAGYIVKGNAGIDFLSAVELVDHFWKIVELPKGA